MGTAAWDNDVNTFFDYSKANGGWTEALLKLTTGPVSVTHLEFYPRTGNYLSRVVGGTFLGIKADNTSFTLGNIRVEPGAHWNMLSIDADVPQQEVVGVRYNSPNGGYGNIAEI